MLQNRNILCISNPSWEGDYAKAIVEIMKVFAKQNRVLFVDNPCTFKDILQSLLRIKKFPYRRTFGLTNRIREFKQPGGEIVYVFTPPPVFPVNFLPTGKIYDVLLRMNGWFVTNSIKKALYKLNMNESLLNVVAFNPSIGTQCGRKFNEKLLIYHCYDEINAAQWLKKHGALLERKMMKMSDATIVTSQGLMDKKAKFSDNCFLVKNGVNVDLFSSVFSENKKTGQQVIGYIGSVDDRLDIELLEFVIQRKPEAQFVFVGRIVEEKNAEVLKRYPNVSLTGPQPVQKLPEILKTFSVGIIPFLRNEFTMGIYPLKVNEYLAAGLPVVSTNFGYMEDFETIIEIAIAKEEFLNRIDTALTDDCADKRLKRLATAKANSWEGRVAEISEIINKLEQKNAS